MPVAIQTIHFQQIIFSRNLFKNIYTTGSFELNSLPIQYASMSSLISLKMCPRSHSLYFTLIRILEVT